MNRYISAILFFSALCLPLCAQNLDREVEVTNDYNARIMEVEKRSLPMQLPDSLRQFNLVFDYSVFEKLYQGAYEFSPYSIKVTPSENFRKGNVFYLAAGAGYTVHPQLSIAWEPLNSSKSQLTILQDLRGFIGKYSDGWDGVDAVEHFALKGSVALPSVSLNYGVGYDGLYNKDYFSSGFYHSAYAALGLKSLPKSNSAFLCDLNLKYRFGTDGFGQSTLNEGRLLTDGTVGFIFKRKYNILVDWDLVVGNVSGSQSRNDIALNVTPNLKLTFGKFTLKAGASFSYGKSLSNTVRFSPYGNINIDIADAFVVFATYKGWVGVNDYHSLKQRNHWLFPSADDLAALDCYAAEMDASAGFRTRISNVFRLETSAGYQKMKGVALENISSSFSPADYNLFYIQASADVTTERVDFDVAARYQKTDVSDILLCNLPAFTGTARILYNWNKRLCGGVSAYASTDRGENIPGYVDLGVELKYCITRKFSLWARGGNLLSNEIYKAPGHSENSINFTAGICLSL